MSVRVVVLAATAATMVGTGSAVVALCADGDGNVKMAMAMEIINHAKVRRRADDETRAECACGVFRRCVSGTAACRCRLKRCQRRTARDTATRGIRCGGDARAANAKRFLVERDTETRFRQLNRCAELEVSCVRAPAFCARTICSVYVYVRSAIKYKFHAH